jgi:hypothetical protein
MISIKAGKASLQGKAIVADAESKGVINCFPMADPGLVQFLFSNDNADGTVIDELILMPFDAGTHSLHLTYRDQAGRRIPTR